MYVNLVGNRDIVVHHVSREGMVLFHCLATFQTVDGVPVAVAMRTLIRRVIHGSDDPESLA